MTLPYGSTQQSCREYLMDWLEDKLGDGDRKRLWPIAVFATPIMWDAIAEVVVAAREAEGRMHGVGHGEGGGDSMRRRRIL